MAAAMVWSGMSVGITNNREQRPHWTNVGSLCEGFVVKALVAFDSGVAYTKRLLFDDTQQLHRPLSNNGPLAHEHSSTASLSKGMMI
eukprot:scaffold4692_cov63-Skeletonema_menzelii.AAC.1